MSRMRNLTLASAKHLLTGGHISPDHHKRIVDAANKIPGMPTMPKMPKPPGKFGSLAKAKKKMPVAALPAFTQQPPPPMTGMGGPAMAPPGLPPGYDQEV